MSSKESGMNVSPVECGETPSRLKLEMAEVCGRVSQLMGRARSTGQIFGLLYFSVEPVCLDEIAKILKISKASCSTGTRELISWNAIRLVWVQGDRKDHFEVDPDMANLLRSAYNEFVKPRIGSSARRIERLEMILSEDRASGTIGEGELKIIEDRLEKLGQLQKKAQALLPLAEKLF